jgi:hypothetical protein
MVFLFATADAARHNGGLPVRHPFDGIEVDHSQAQIRTSRRSALGRMLCGVFGVVGLNTVAQAQQVTTQLVGEEGAAKPLTRRLGEGGVATTLAIGEEGAAGGVPRPAPNSTDLSDKQMETLWEQMGDKDPQKGAVAANGLFAGKQVVPFLKGKLTAKEGIDQKGLAPLLKGLDADAFAEREAALDIIVKLGPTALPAIRAAAKNATSLEVSRRLQMAEMKIKESPEFVRGQRGLQILGDLPGKDARAIVEDLSKQSPESWLTQEAKAILARGIRLPAPPPVPVPRLPVKPADR